MSTFANKDFNSVNYEQFRPVYPDKFYHHLRCYIGGADVTAEETVDLACGTGQATRALSKWSHHVRGVDLSESMIREANIKNDHSNIVYETGSDASLDNLVAPHSIDLLTVAEGAHWFQYPEFWERAHRALKPGGTLALWSYWTFMLVDYPVTKEIIESYAYSPKKLGPYWDSGRKILDRGYRDLEMPASLFKNQERRINLCSTTGEDEPFDLIRTDVPVSALIDMLKTWSSYHTWKRLHPDEPDLADAVLDEIHDSTGLTATDKVNVKWNTVYMLGKSV